LVEGEKVFAYPSNGCQVVNPLTGIFVMQMPGGTTIGRRKPAGDDINRLKHGKENSHG
jgi:hypothetical protein